MQTLFMYSIVTFHIAVSLALAIVAVRYWAKDRNAKTIEDEETIPLPGHRGLFRFSDGVNRRTVDPIQILIALEDHPEYLLSQHPRMVADGHKGAIKITVDAVRKIFGVPEFTEREKPGLTVRECLALLNAFFWYLNSQKKSTEPLPTSAESTEQTSIKSESETTSDTLVSGSTASVELPSMA